MSVGSNFDAEWKEEVESGIVCWSCVRMDKEITIYSFVLLYKDSLLLPSGDCTVEY